MFLEKIKSLSILIALAGCVYGSIADTPHDQVDSYLVEHGLARLHEVQLFDRMSSEDDAVARQRIAYELSSLYLRQLAQDGLDQSHTDQILAKGQVLVGLVPGDILLDLRIELLIKQYSSIEQYADLFLLGLLSEDSKEESILKLNLMVSELGRIAKISNVQAETLARSVPRANQDRAADFEQKLGEARSVRSRAYFFYGWSAYTDSVLREKQVGPNTFEAFGRVLGLEGALPVLEQVDLDLLEYDHVARAMLGVALCKIQNQDYASARVWLKVLQDSALTPESIQRVAKQRLLDVSLAEFDWIEALRIAEDLEAIGSDADGSSSALGISQARRMVVYPLELLSNRQTSVGNGGREGALELARRGLKRLIELGEIAHILELQSRFGELPLQDGGFISLYAQGLSMLKLAEEEVELGNDGQRYFQKASEMFTEGLKAGKVNSFDGVVVHAGDAALKLVEVLLQLEQFQTASQALEEYRAFFRSDRQQEAALWSEVLIYDAAVRSGQGQLGEQLGERVGEYIRKYPRTNRANRLMIQFALSPYMDSDFSAQSLVIDDDKDPLAHAARRKLIQLAHSEPALLQKSSESTTDSDIYQVFLTHAQWVWRHESSSYETVQEARDRVAVCRIISKRGMEHKPVDTSMLHSVIDRAESILREEPSFEQYAQEFVYRRVQLLMIEGNFEQAGQLSMDSKLWTDYSIQRAALFTVFEQVNRRFVIDQSVENAQSVIQYGRGALDHVSDQSEGKLDRTSSHIAESMATAAGYLHEQTGDSLMKEYATALSIRVWEQGKPSGGGLVRTAILTEESGETDIALASWLRLVSTVDDQHSMWHMARYESLRLLFDQDQPRGKEVLEQYLALYPNGSLEPWGSKIDALVVEHIGGAP